MKKNNSRRFPALMVISLLILSPVFLLKTNPAQASGSMPDWQEGQQSESTKIRRKREVLPRKAERQMRIKSRKIRCTRMTPHRILHPQKRPHSPQKRIQSLRPARRRLLSPGIAKNRR